MCISEHTLSAFANRERTNTMKLLRVSSVGGLLLAVLTALGCSQSPTKSPDVTGAVRQSLDQAGLKDVSVKQDRDRGVVTLGGHVASDAAKNQAEGIAKPLAAGQVVADEIAVIPPGEERVAKTVN